MKRHRWVAASDKPKRHHGRCEHCGLIRQREPGSHTTHYARADQAGRLVAVPSDGRTPPCRPVVAQ